MINNHLDRRALGHGLSAIVLQLQQAAKQAAASGDIDAARAFQQEIDRLREAMRNDSLTLAEPVAGGKAELNTALIPIQWASLQADNVYIAKTACVFDCGARGTLTLTPHGLTMTGDLDNDPAAIMLIARHGQLNWNSKINIHGGSDELRFKLAVASEMLGVKTKGARISGSRRTEADTLKAAWKPQLDAMLYGSVPSRPRTAPAPAPAVRVSVPA
jgi:hypothetical protein